MFAYGAVWECLYAEKERLALCKRPLRAIFLASTDPIHMRDPAFEWFVACVWMVDSSGSAVAFEREFPNSRSELVDVGKRVYLGCSPGLIGNNKEVLKGQSVDNPSYLNRVSARCCLSVLTKKPRSGINDSPSERQKTWFDDIRVWPPCRDADAAWKVAEWTQVYLKPPTAMSGAKKQYHAMARLVNQQDLGLGKRSYRLPLPYNQIDDPDAQSEHDSAIDDGELSESLSETSDESATPDERVIQNANQLVDVLMGKSIRVLYPDDFMPPKDVRGEVVQLIYKVLAEGIEDYRFNGDVAFMGEVPCSVLLITGPPGSGKTQYGSHVGVSLALQCNAISVIAPTNAAAANVARSFQNVIQTHRLDLIVIRAFVKEHDDLMLRRLATTRSYERFSKRGLPSELWQQPLSMYDIAAALLGLVEIPDHQGRLIQYCTKPHVVETRRLFEAARADVSDIETRSEEDGALFRHIWGMVLSLVNTHCNVVVSTPYASTEDHVKVSRQVRTCAWSTKRAESSCRQQ
jgi:hypothetical protein